MTFLEKAIRPLTRLLSWAGMAALLVMMFLLATSVVMRYVFNKPIPGDLEFSSFLMVAVVMLGFAYTQSENGHVAVELLVDRFPPRIQALVDIINFLLAIGMMSLIIWQSSGQGFYSFRTGDTSTIVQIPFFIFKFLVPIGFFAWSLESLLKVGRSIIKLREKA